MSSRKKRIGNYVLLLDEKLGSGSFASVYRGLIEQTSQPCAIKVLPRAMIQEDQYTKNAFFTEVYIMKKLKSSNIIKFIDVHESKNNFYVILEIADGGTLKDIMIDQGRIDQKDVMRYLIQILNGMGELVKNGVIHRDIKPQNILVKNDKLKLGDFGFAKNTQNNSFMKTIVGTPAYMSPQILNQQKYTYKCDIWALGVIIYEMLTGKLPWVFKDTSLKGIYKSIVSNKVKLPKDMKININLRDLIDGCLQIEEADRMDWQQIYLHPLFGDKFQSNFKNKKQNSIKMAFIISQLRMKIHSDNINIDKILHSINEKLNKEELNTLFHMLEPQFTQIDLDVVYNTLNQNGIVLKNDLEKLFKKNGIRMKGLDLETYEKDLGTNKISLLVMCRIKKKIDSESIDIYDLYQSKDIDRKNALDAKIFAKLILQIDKQLKNTEIDALFEQFDNNKDGLISFNEFYKGICKIAQIVAIKN